MSEVKTENISSKRTLNNTGKIILITTWVLSLLLIIVGIIVATDKQAETPALTAGKVTQTETEEWEYYSYTFTPAANTYYYIYIDGGRLTSFTDEDDTNVSFQQVTNRTDYEIVYRAYLYKNETYNLKVYATGSSISIKASQN